ncbi:SpoIID/LytB domain-containing protein [Sporomusa aerivorans]|uniref:SpoIID/LytB domain-containing protein n=1 Tax=Sporomusa aerivorans TaxID=204936 RepID=UPI00352A53BC
MPKHMVKWLLLAFLLVLVPLAGQAKISAINDGLFNAEPSLRVGILTGQQNAQISADANFDLVDTADAKILGSFRAYDTATLILKDGYFFINGVRVLATGIDVVQKKEDLIVNVEQYIYVNNRRYRGDIGIHRTAGKSGMTVVNTLPVEQYLYGIIKNEISPDWAMEAVKSQAVAARTYAMASYNKHKADGFDVCATTDCQVYGGRESEAPRAIEAVDSTRGLVLMNNGKLITASFHSSSGGYTENSENVWLTQYPYLRGVVDFDQNCPYYKWEKKLTIAELSQAIEKAGYNVGSLQAIELSPLDKPPVVSADRGVSGRVKNIRFLGSSGSIQVPGEKVRRMLDLKSTLFDIATDNEPQEFAMPVHANRSKEEGQIRSSLTLSASAGSTDIRPIHGQPTDVIVISGFGWGHGVGLSQWGAKAMAEKAPPGNTEYFKDILKHYYQDVEIKKAY